MKVVQPHCYSSHVATGNLSVTTGRLSGGCFLHVVNKSNIGYFTAIVAKGKIRQDNAGIDCEAQVNFSSPKIFYTEFW